MIPLANFALQHGLGEAFAEAGYQLSDDPPTVRQPDISVLCANRASMAPRDGYFQGAPDVAIEAVSPSDKAADLDLKVRQYLDAGSTAVAVVHPQTRTVWIHRPRGSAQLLGAGRNLEIPEALPGWSLPLAEIIAPLDEVQG